MMTMKGLRRIAPGLAALALGCDGPGSTGAPGGDILFDVPPVPEGAVRLVSPTFSVAAGSEVFMCMRVPLEVKEDLHVNSSLTYAAEGGHHVLLYYAPPGQEPPDEAPHECTDADMGNIRFVHTGNADGNVLSLPPGTAMKIPEGSRLYSQSHYVNATGAVITGQDVVDLVLIPADEVETRASAFVEVDLGLELPASAETTREIDCTAPLDMDVPWMIPHMHESGHHFKIEIVSAGAPVTIYETEWNATYRDQFPLVTFDPPLHLTPDDRLRTTCVWRNTGPHPLLFPAEMCATFMSFYPSVDGALLACDETGRHFQP